MQALQALTQTRLHNSVNSIRPQDLDPRRLKQHRPQKKGNIKGDLAEELRVRSILASEEDLFEDLDMAMT